MEIQHAIPTQLGDLQLLSLLGQGSAGKVYLAKHHTDDWRVAVKVIRPRWVHSEHVTARFKAEARILSRISHPNVVRLLDFGSLDDGRLYLVMEWLDGISLDTLLSRRAGLRMTLAEALPYVLQICAALQEAHDQGVIHRDLKPQNIIVLFGHPLTLKVVDFGVAKLLAPDEPESLLTAVGEIIGTPLFMAPEQIESRWPVGTETDLYTLGLILYMMLGGAHPFAEEEELHEVLVHHLLDPPPPLGLLAPDLPEAVVEVVHRCLEKNPAHRPSSANAVAATFLTTIDEACPVDLIDFLEPRPTPLHDYQRATTVYYARSRLATPALVPSLDADKTQVSLPYDRDEDVIPIPRREMVCLPPPAVRAWRSWIYRTALVLIMLAIIVGFLVLS